VAARREGSAIDDNHKGQHSVGPGILIQVYRRATSQLAAPDDVLRTDPRRVARWNAGTTLGATGENNTPAVLFQPNQPGDGRDAKQTR